MKLEPHPLVGHFGVSEEDGERGGGYICKEKCRVLAFSCLLCMMSSSALTGTQWLEDIMSCLELGGHYKVTSIFKNEILNSLGTLPEIHASILTRVHLCNDLCSLHGLFFL